MNATELKTYRQSLWLTREAAAKLFNVQDRVYRYWESGDWAIPADVEELLLALDYWLSEFATNAWNAYTTIDQRQDTPISVVLIRYSNDEDLWRFYPQMTQLTHTLHAAGIDRARQALQHGGAEVRLVTMERQAYEDWRIEQKMQDSADTRNAWAATVTDPPTRAKKTAKPSGEDFQR